MREQMKALDDLEMGDLWAQALQRTPKPDPDPESHRSSAQTRIMAAVVAITVFVVAGVFAVNAFKTDEPPEPAVSSPPTPSLTGFPRVTGHVQLPRNTTGGDVALGAGSVWVETYPLTQDGPNSLVRIDPATNRITATIPTGVAHGVAANSDAVWVTEVGVLDRIDPATNEIVAKVDLPAGSPVAVTATTSDAWVVVGNSGGGTLVRVDQATNEIVAEIPLGPEITDYEGQVLVGAGSVWVLGTRWNGKDGASQSAEYGSDLIRIDPATNQIVARIPVDGFRMAVGDDAVWVKFPPDGVFDSYNEDWLWTKVDTATNQPSPPFKMDTAGLELVTTEALWSVDYDGSADVRVIRIDPNTHEVVSRSEPIRSYMSGAVIDPASGSVWIPTMDTITRVDISSR